ncbi:MAG TPA: DUF1343 domain-containing protein [Bacteroidales bacterium]|nr:DUF1343 domain-containing protein [Bacteroidales bacterium]HSA44046.1 DUF1343 domain-containing protein [Bacteroidales bacterium]
MFPRPAICLLFAFLALIPSLPAGAQGVKVLSRALVTDSEVKVGASRFDQYLPLIRGRKVALMANHTTLVGRQHLADTLRALGTDIRLIFSPEHGFRGSGEAGEAIADEKDPKTGIQIISLYGNKLKPSPAHLKGIDLVIFDLQDVGVRFYTYASSMQYLMEACADAGIPLLILDRPNPNGYFIDGPVLDPGYASFVGLNPVPIVHGLTLGEYALMIQGEGWLKKGRNCSLKVIPVHNYRHDYLYQIPVAPSPNLPNMAAVYLYPSLGLFEGTAISVGRGTSKPFQVIGFPGLKDGSVTFTPVAMPGFSMNPPYLDQLCHGFDLKEFSENFVKDSGRLFLYWLTELYRDFPDKKAFFNDYFDTLAGGSGLRKQIKEGLQEEDIRRSWSDDLLKYKKLRKKYLLYPDFE